jgi:ectoine hydroxylase-related dioxygenase (phytanoyl-CoA dioxygenase family)
MVLCISDNATVCLLQRINLWQSNHRARHLLFESAKVFGKLACQLEGIERIRIWHDQALYKEAWANPTSWHVDVPYWSFDSVHAISLWVALDDATEKNGCMYFIPGSHKIIKKDYEERGEFKEIKIGKNMADVFQAFPEARSLRSVAVPMKAGSCSFHSGMLIHGANANMTASRRRAMTVQMMPDGSRFNGKQNVLTNEQFKSLNFGDMLDWKNQNPLLYDTS